MRTPKTTISALIVALVGVLALSACSNGEPSSSPSSTYVAPAELSFTSVTAGGVTQAVACIGQGSPTVVYVNGLLIGGKDTWQSEALTQGMNNRVCVIDRAGTGQSTARPATASNGPVQNAKELLAALEAVGEPGPYVYVAWSYGAIVARSVIAISPAKAAGLVLVDGSLPSQYKSDRTGWNEGGQNLDMAAAYKLIGSDSGPKMGSKPLVVLEAGLDNSPANVKAAWTAGQKAAATMSTNSVYGVVQDVAHTIPQQAANAVVVATDAVVASARSSNAPLGPCPSTFPPAGIKCMPA